METKLELLKNNIIFIKIENDDLSYVASFFEYKEYEKGEFLFHENNQRDSFMIIVSGKVEISKNMPAGSRKIVELSDGDFLGEGMFFEDFQHANNAECVEKSRILFLTNERMQVLRREKPNLYYYMMEGVSKLLSKRLQFSSSVIADKKSCYIAGEGRIEHDLLGDRSVPDYAYYGVQTLRAVENFPITGIPIYHFPNLIKGLAYTKKAAVSANMKLDLIEKDKAEAIMEACDDIIDGKYHDNFVVDVVQGGAGTSTNMNANEVIANIALEKLGHKKGEYDIIHPNNHINLSQSTNDAYPTSIKLGLLFSLSNLLEAMTYLKKAFEKKELEFSDILKMGRTQLQDAVPMTLGQEFGSYGTMLGEDILMLKRGAKLLTEINMGGTAIGTGINADPRYAEIVTEDLKQMCGLDLTLSGNLVEATQDTGGFVQLSGIFKRICVKLSKVCNDLRLLSSGPRAGFNEINLPPMQPGSSIMPGKVNPVIPEVVNQVAFQIIGNDLAVTMAAEAGQLELNVMEPLISFNLFQSIDMMRNAMMTLADKCILGITANRDVCRSYIENSIGIVTALVPRIGYENSTLIAKEALKTGKSVYNLVLEKNLLSKEELDNILSPSEMIKPRIVTGKDNR